MKKKRILGIIFSFVLLAILAGFAIPRLATYGENDKSATKTQCTSIIVGKHATVDGSVMCTTSLDGGPSNSTMLIQSGHKYRPGTMMPRLGKYPCPQTYQQILDYFEGGFDYYGDMPQAEETYRTLYLIAMNGEIVGGMNEHGVTMGINSQGMKLQLANPNGQIAPGMPHPSTGSIALGLARAKTAREAIQIMGALAEEYGFNYHFSPTSGVNVPVADKNEAWLFECMGVGPNWTPGCGRPGAVWCAQRVPDGEVACNANRSRIGEIDLSNSDYFMASSNVYSLAQEMGLWHPGEPFVWYNVYGVPGGQYNSLREWAVLNSVAPSLHLDPNATRFPFSVKPDDPVSVQKLMAIHGSYYEGTKFDITEDPKFYVGGNKSPLARPWGPSELFNLLGIKPYRCIGTPTSGYTFVTQIRDWLPEPIAGCMWFAYGPAYSSCFAPIYSGILKLPKSWSCGVDPTYPPSWLVQETRELVSGQLNRDRTVTNFLLVHDLSMANYQNAIADIGAVCGPAEDNFFAMQPDIERIAVEIFKNRHGQTRAEIFLTEYTNRSLCQVSDAYYDLVDYLLFKYHFRYSKNAPSLPPPKVEPPVMPDLPSWDGHGELVIPDWCGHGKRQPKQIEKM